MLICCFYYQLCLDYDNKYLFLNLGSIQRISSFQKIASLIFSKFKVTIPGFQKPFYLPHILRTLIYKKKQSIGGHFLIFNIVFYIRIVHLKIQCDFYRLSYMRSIQIKKEISNTFLLLLFLIFYLDIWQCQSA